MTVDEIVTLVDAWDGVLVFAPGPDDGVPEIAWGDVFVYYAPDGRVPEATQPFATVITKDYPDDATSRLDREGAFRVNLHPGRATFEQLSSEAPTGSPDDRFLVHPVYGSMGWLAVTNPGVRTAEALPALLREAYELDRARHERRQGLAQG